MNRLQQLSGQAFIGEGIIVVCHGRRQEGVSALCYGFMKIVELNYLHVLAVFFQGCCQRKGKGGLPCAVNADNRRPMLRTPGFQEY